MNAKTKIIGGLVIGSGLALYIVNKRKNVKNAYVVEEYIIGSKDDAVSTLEQLNENAKKYGVVSVTDYYDLLGVTSYYGDSRYGWNAKAISKAKIKEHRQGWIIVFPKVEVI